jgi:hypothetical protein
MGTALIRMDQSDVRTVRCAGGQLHVGAVLSVSLLQDLREPTPSVDSPATHLQQLLDATPY